MLRTVDHNDAWPVSVSNKEEEVESKADFSIYSNANLTEHDYMGLSTTSLVPPAQSTQLIYSTGRDQCDVKGEGLERGDTELRLGIGPVGNGDLSPASHATHAARQPPLAITRQRINQGDPALDATCHPSGDVLPKSSIDVEQSFWPRVAPGRFRIPVPKVSTASGKRLYGEIGTESGDNKAFASDFSSESGVLQEAASHFKSGPRLSMVPSSLQRGLYIWSHKSTTVANWQSNSDAGATYGNSYTWANRPLPPPPAFNLPPTSPVSDYSVHPPSTPASAVAPLTSSHGRGSLTSHNGQEDARMSKAPVVGWPPVRSFRKNTLHSTAVPGTTKASSDLPKQEDANNNTETGGEKKRVVNTDTLFVKAKLDGVCICRKVDLTSYNNYESLKMALQEMFQGFICNDNAKLDLLQGVNYVLTHEDKDGDWMLVGDVPWHMFVTTVKSLRIMKAVDAVGLGEKVLAKLRGQDVVHEEKVERALEAVH